MALFLPRSFVVLIPSVIGLQMRDHLDLHELEPTDVSSKNMTLMEEFMEFGINHALVKPKVCDDYMKNTGCSWTANFSCPNQPLAENNAVATQDESIGYHCCCDVGLWNEDNARQGALATLTIQAQKCADIGEEATHCEWTSEYPCPGQYRGSKYKGDAGGQIDTAYSCCCVLGYWRKSVKRDLKNFNLRLKQESTCDAHLDQHGCSWASQSRCDNREKAVGLIAKLTQDAQTDAYTCCCEQQLWKKETAHCDSYLSTEGCHWTAERNCPDQPAGADTKETATDDDSIGYDCCCQRGLWKRWFKRTRNTSEPMFVHIPKNAGTSIEEVSGNHGIWYPRKWQHFWHGVDMPDGAMCEKYHVPPQYLRAAGEPDEDAEVFDVPGSFCVVRHPYERAVSEYLYMLTVEWGRPMSSTYQTRLEGKPECTKAGLNIFLQSVLYKVRDGRKYLHDCHFLPQTDYIYGRDGKQWCNNILKQDQLPGAYNKFMEKWGLPARLSKFKDNNTTAVCDGRITVKDLNWETRKMMNELYEKDFRKLGYRMW